MSGYPQFGYNIQPQPIGGQTDPQTQAYLQAMKALGAGPQGSPAGVGENLMAQALMQYAQRQRMGQQGLSTAYANPNSLANNPDVADQYAGLY